MRASRFSTILLFTTAWATAGPLVAQEGGREDSSLRATVTLPSTESRVVHSEVLDRDLRVYVAFPPGYGTGATYPVLYALDAN
jgi:enterochelin esterase-like enzyme